MSRSNPTENGTVNPAKRWFEWNGETGTVRYYDKTAKKNVDMGAEFTFILLDQVGSVRGWHDASESGIYSNEVKDTRQEVFVVKSFKGGTLAEGIYKNIKDRISALGGQFVTNCYIAVKLDGVLEIASLRLKGAALGSWMEFCKAHRADLYKKAVKIHGFTEGKKGRIVFRVPVLKLTDISEPTNEVALTLDRELQEFFASYFTRTKREQVEVSHVSDEQIAAGTHEASGFEDEPAAGLAPLMDDDIPF